MNQLQRSIERLIEKHGSTRKAARALDIHYSYLSRLRRGLQCNPNAAVLQALGLNKKMTFAARQDRNRK
jgi:hypothetical protein